jgi:hypothetical protein
LEERGIDSSGQKQELVDRLVSTLVTQANGGDSDHQSEIQKNEAEEGDLTTMDVHVPCRDEGAEEGEARTTLGRHPGDAITWRLFKVVYGNAQVGTSDLVYVGQDGALASTDPYFAKMGMLGEAMISLFAAGHIPLCFPSMFHFVYLRDFVQESLLLTGDAAVDMTRNFTVMCDRLSLDNPEHMTAVVVPSPSTRWNTTILATRSIWEDTSRGYAGNFFGGEMDLDAELTVVPTGAGGRKFHRQPGTRVRDLEEMARANITQAMHSRLQPILFADANERALFYLYLGEVNERQRKRLMSKDNAVRLACGDDSACLQVAFHPSSLSNSTRATKRKNSLGEKSGKTKKGNKNGAKMNKST